MMFISHFCLFSLSVSLSALICNLSEHANPSLNMKCSQEPALFLNGHGISRSTQFTVPEFLDLSFKAQVLGYIQIEKGQSPIEYQRKCISFFSIANASQNSFSA